MKTQTSDLHELAVKANRFSAVFSALSDGVIATDAEGRIAEANPAAHRLLSRSKLAGESLADLLPAGRAETVERRDARLVRRWRSRAEDRELILEVTTTPSVDEFGSPVGAVHTLRDITEQAQLMRLKDEFLFAVAHELRTPVSSLSASLELLHEDATIMKPEELRAMAATLRRSALRLEALIENLLDIGSIQAGTFQVRAAIVSLKRCINVALVTTRPICDSKQQKVHAKVAPGAERVIADSHRTNQVLINLITNASKYSPDGKDIHITAEPEDGSVRVSVRDQGDGIPPAERVRIFDRFYRSRINRSEGGGIGLGLAICRAIVEAQGGEIGVEDGPGGGAVLYFTIPRARDQGAFE